MSVFTSSYSDFNISSKTVFVSVLSCICGSEYTGLFSNWGILHAFDMNSPVSFVTYFARSASFILFIAFV